MQEARCLEAILTPLVVRDGRAKDRGRPIGTVSLWCDSRERKPAATEVLGLTRMNFKPADVERVGASAATNEHELTIQPCASENRDVLARSRVDHVRRRCDKVASVNADARS
jgi:hypothetical protein